MQLQKMSGFMTLQKDKNFMVFFFKKITINILINL